MLFRDDFIKQSEWPEVLVHNKYPDTVVKAIHKEKNKTLLKRFANYIGAVMIGILFIWGALQLEGIGLIILLLIGGSFLSYCLGNFKAAMKTIADRFKQIPNKDLKTLVKCFYKEHYDAGGIADFGTAYSCLSPYTTTKIDIQQFKQSWENRSAKLIEPLKKQLKSRHKTFDQFTGKCEICGDSFDAFVLREKQDYNKILKKAEYDYVRCEKCQRIYCKTCITKNKIKKCRCEHNDLRNAPYTFLVKDPAIRLRPIESGYDKAVKVGITENTPAPNITKVTWSREYAFNWYVPFYQEEYATKEVAPTSKCYASVTVENHAIKVSGKWYLIAPTLGDVIELS